ncbi:dephospho-CoA kinase [Schnuerera sp.]|uniref:dephospho-CoA kinase n=1 Tax=Schnuerera sp. TaxID=2794844 RepID=UPI002C9E54BA|nr:dephospho-CoA kinase [Schnuerera sp.]HSH36260.1 dephospho-CoA kinase [Schnuerera sp.]
MNQNRIKIIGVTGGIATGKSTVSGIIDNMGYKVIDADKIAKDVVKIGKPGYQKIIDVFGKDILDENCNINRKKLGRLIFEDSILREKLNNIVHSFVLESIKDLINKYRNESIIFVDVPLLIEEMDKLNEYEITFDEIWLVYVDESTQLDRLIKRDLISKDEAIKKIRAQIPIELKREYATRIIDNRKDLETLEEQVKNIVDKLR